MFESNTETMTPETKEELQASITKMRQATKAFYVDAIHTGNHAFIEFCGLMGEYIKICQTTLDQGIDFTKANIHCGQNLVFMEYNKKYLKEKLGCIYGTSLAKEIIPVTESDCTKEDGIMLDSNTEIKPGMKFLDIYRGEWTVQERDYAYDDGWTCSGLSMDKEIIYATFLAEGILNCLSTHSNTVS